MTVQISWLVEGHVLAVQICGTVVLADVEAVASTAVAYEHAMPTNTLYWLMDLTAIEQFDLLISDATHLPAVGRLINTDKQGCLAYYPNINPYIAYMLQLWNQALKPIHFLFPDREEAL